MVYLVPPRGAGLFLPRRLFRSHSASPPMMATTAAVTTMAKIRAKSSTGIRDPPICDAHRGFGSDPQPALDDHAAKNLTQKPTSPRTAFETPLPTFVLMASDDSG
jgi:hypothetical protein